MAGPDFSALETKYGLPAGLLAAQQHVESGGRDVTSPAGAMGPAQFMPATALALGIDPHDPAQAADGQARLMRQNIDASGGDLDHAVMMYHGGPDERNWGAKTHAYPGKIVAALGSSQAPIAPASAPDNAPDPFENALSGHSAPTSNDPFESALLGGKAGNAVISVGGNSPSPVSTGANDSADAVSSGMVSVRQVAPGQMAGPTSGAGQDGLLNNIGHGIADFGNGVSEGYDKLQTGLAGLVLRGTDAAGLTSGMHDGLNKYIADNAQYRDSDYYNPNGYARPIGSFVGETAPLAPLSEIKAFSAAPEASRIGQALAKYGNLSAQGATGGALSSGGNNIMRNAAIGAGIAPVFGAALEKAIIPAAGAIASGARKLVPDAAKEALASGLAKFGRGDVADGAATVGATNSAPLQPGESPVIRTGADLSKLTPEQIKAGDFGHGGPMSPEELAAVQAANPDGLTGEVTYVEPAPANPVDSLGAAGSRRGIEGTKAVPASVATNVAELTGQGVPADHALNEAAIRYVGGEPTVATATRNRIEMHAEREGAKQATPEGAALAARAADNNAALHSTVQQTVDSYGGMLGHGEAAQSAAESLAKSSDATKAKVSGLYDVADQEAAAAKADADTRNGAALDQHAQSTADIHAEYQAQVEKIAEENARRAGLPIPKQPIPDAPAMPAKPVGTLAPGYIDMAPLKAALDNPELEHSTVDGAKTLRSGIKGLIKAYGGDDGMVTLRQAEKLRQAINAAYDPLGSGINQHVGELKSVLDQTLDDASTAPAYRAARAAYKDWASQYDDPDGVARLIKRDASGNFLNADNWRTQENALTHATSDKAFGQVARQLARTSDTDALAKLKSSIVQSAYEKATGSAANETGNPVFNARRWETELNKVGLPKLNAVFSQDEIAHLAMIGRAARALNEGVPGTDNGSNTASTLANALRGAQGSKDLSGLGKSLKIGAHILGSHVPVAGPIAVETGASIVGARGAKAAQRRLAEAIQMNLDPAAARTAANENAIQEATIQQRKAASASLARALAAPLSTRKGER